MAGQVGTVVAERETDVRMILKGRETVTGQEQSQSCFL